MFGKGEFRAILVLSLGFGLVGIDRYLISAMFPSIARDLHLDYADIGTIAGALAFAWGLAALFMGNVADRFGRRKVMVGSLIVFSLLIGASGLAVGLGGLVAVRVIMGLADGAYTPACISANIAASIPAHRGRNFGIQQAVHLLFGLGICPLIVALLIDVISWRWIFVIFLIPGLGVALLTHWHIPDNGEEDVAPESPKHGSIPLGAWRSVLAIANVRILMILMLCWLTCLITTSAFLPSYFIDHLKLTDAQMGTVMSAIGFGAAGGALILASASDRLGRKPIVFIAAAGALASLGGLAVVGANPILLFVMLFATSFFNYAGLSLTVGPACTESVPAGLMATASGMVIACGELLGGGLAPIAAGHFAKQFGIEHVLFLPMAALALAVVLALNLRETLSHLEGSPYVGVVGETQT